ncbi:hypothetical protein KEM54_005983, partial [Ascosphaera aggregata]
MTWIFGPMVQAMTDTIWDLLADLFKPSYNLKVRTPQSTAGQASSRRVYFTRWTTLSARQSDYVLGVKARLVGGWVKDVTHEFFVPQHRVVEISDANRNP